MISPPVSGSQHNFRPAPLLEHEEISVRATPPPYLGPSPPPPGPADLLRDPSLDLGCGFRHSGWASTRHRVGRAIAKAYPDRERFVRFCRCGSAAWVVKHPGKPFEYKVMSDYCHDRFCLPCAAIRARTIAGNLAAALEGQQVRFVTLTLRSEPGDPLSPLLDRLHYCFARLRRHQWWASRVDGGICILEVKYVATSRRWHPHLHLLVQGRYLPQPELAALWLKYTQDSYIVDVRMVRGTGLLTHYVTKYVAKPGDYTTLHSPLLLLEMVKSLQGRRLCSTFGHWRGFRLLDRGEAVGWLFVDTLAGIFWAAREGDDEARRILHAIRYTPDIDEPVQHELPYPDT